jgi:DNA-binding transcriptional MerR regulator
MVLARGGLQRGRTIV